MSKAKMTEKRQAFYDKIDTHHMTPLWSVLGALVTDQPQSNCQPHIWKYESARKFLMEAGELITASEAERRVLILENPGLRGQSKITTSLYGGLQLILPGEIAPSHRHAQSALRFILEGTGAHTAVGGEKTIMREGDFVITPSWDWHDHGNESDEPMIWLDGLDIPVVQFFDASFCEQLNETEQVLSRGTGDAQARYGAGLLPVDFEQKGHSSPIFNYPYARTREALETMRKQQAWDPCHGLKMKYVNPVDGGFAMPTIATFMQLLPKGFHSANYRSTDATVYVPVEGHGKTYINDTEFAWGPRDVFVVPSWHTVRHETQSDAVLFSFSDRGIQQKLGLWREDRGNA